MIRRRVRRAGVVAAALVALAFLALPIVAIFARALAAVHALAQRVVTDALVVSLKTTVAAQALVLALGTPTAYVLATHRFRGRSLVVTLVELPLVLPPAVAGIGLLAAFGRFGLLAHRARRSRRPRSSSRSRSCPGPLYVRQAIAAFEAVDETLVAASRTLGAGPVKTFFRVVLPLARGGLGAGEALAFARGLGEFGATIMFAGSLRGVTQTLPLAVYQEFDVNFNEALALGAPPRAHQRRPSRHPQMARLLLHFSFRFAPSTSSWRSPSSARLRSSGRRGRARRRCCASSPGCCARARRRVARRRLDWNGVARRRSAASASSSRTTRSSRT